MRLSREEQIILGVGLVTAVTISVIGFMVTRPKSVPKKDYGLRVGPQCASHEFTDTAKVKETISTLLNQKSAQGAVDPFMVTSEWIRKAAGTCKAYPERTRNPGEASLYQEIFYTVVGEMREKDLISDDMLETYLSMVDSWAESQGAQSPADG